MTNLFSGFNPFPSDQPTPQSPPHLMPSYAGSMNEKPNLATAVGGSPANSQYRQQNNPGFNTFPTPSSSAAGTVPPTTAHDMDIDVNMAGVSDEEMGGYNNNGKRRGSVSAEDQHDLFRNHDRSTGAAKRRQSVDENPRQDHKGALSMSARQQLINPAEVLPLYLLCQKTYTPLYPSPTMNILPLYNLTSIAESVARFDPITGAKKKLRKSYKGKILDLPGKNEIPPKKAPPPEAVEGGEKPPQPANRSLGLLELLDWPDEEWCAQKVAGKEVGRGISQDALKKALSMAPGPIPGFDPAVLGLDDIERQNRAASAPFANKNNTPSTSNATPHHPSQQTQLSPPHQQPNGATPGAASSASGSPADSRIKRTIRKKRRKYDDNSFEGYGEGYEDDDVGEEYGDDGVKKKKKRKKAELPGGVSSVSSGINITTTPAGTGIYAR